MAANDANSQLRSEVHIPQRDGMTSSPSHVGTPREELVQIVPLQEWPLQGPLQAYRDARRCHTDWCHRQ